MALVKLGVLISIVVFHYLDSVMAMFAVENFPTIPDTEIAHLTLPLLVLSFVVC